MLIHWIQLAVEAKGGEGQHIRSEVLYACVVVRARLVPQETGCVFVMPEIESGLYKQPATPHPAQLFLNLIEMFVGVTAWTETRRVADSEAVARINSHLRQTAPGVADERLLKRRCTLGSRGDELPGDGCLRDSEQIGREKGLPAAEDPLVISTARSVAVRAIEFRRSRQLASVDASGRKFCQFLPDNGSACS